MIPYLAEFLASTSKLRPISEVMPGRYAVVRTLDLERAFLAIVTACENGWVHGTILSQDNRGRPPPTFSRPSTTLALPVSIDEALELQSKYKVMFD
jgi:hypothetical protein